MKQEILLKKELYWKRKKKLRHTRFPVNFTQFLKTPFLQNTSGQLLLKHWVKVCHQWSKNWFVCSNCTLVWQNKTCLRCSKCRNANKKTLREKCPNTEFFLVRVFPLSDWIWRDTSISPYSVQIRENTNQKKLCIWTLFTQWEWNLICSWKLRTPFRKTAVLVNLSGGQNKCIFFLSFFYFSNHIKQ